MFSEVVTQLCDELVLKPVQKLFFLPWGSVKQPEEVVNPSSWSE